MKRNFLIVISLAVLVVGLFWWSQRVEESFIISTVTVRGQKVHVEIASTPAEMSRGLAGVTDLDWDQGMLFTFPQANTYRFWMKDMLIPIDIIWLRDGQVVDLHQNVPVPRPDETKLPVYQSQEIVDQVLEVRAGFIERFGLEVGDTVLYD